MSRLPRPGQDEGTWGTILNDFLAVAHTTGGQLASNTVSDTQVSSLSQSKITGLTAALDAKVDADDLTSGLAAKADASSLTAHAADTTAIHGIADTSKLTLANGGGKDAISAHGAVSGAVVINMADGNVHTMTLAGSVTLSVTGATNGFSCGVTVKITQDAAVSRTVTFPTAVWEGGVVPTMTSTVGARDIFGFSSDDGGATLEGYVIAADIR